MPILNVNRNLRLALFVEGSTISSPNNASRQLHIIFNDRLSRVLGIRAFDRIIPISKKHIVAMDPRNPPMSGAGERLDQLMIRIMKDFPYDCAIVSWDLIPPWNPEANTCRWTETVDFYRYLSESKHLPLEWRREAGKRYDDLRLRLNPGDRTAPYIIGKSRVVAICMDPMFDILLTQDESVIRESLNVRGRRVPQWPTIGWGNPAERNPDNDLLAPAVAAAGALNPRPSIFRRIRGDYRTRKEEWADYFLGRILANRGCREKIISHGICRRMAETLSGMRK